MTNNRQLIIFTKAPVAGQCKTRLIPLLGEQGATDFYKRLVRHCVDTARQLRNIDIAIYTCPDTQHAFIQQLNTDHRTSLHYQQGNDLGERMYHAIATSLKTYSQCVLIGSDCPMINTRYIEQAFSALNENDISLGPASDGGYVLIGCRRIAPAVFSNTAWSSNTVLQQAIKNIKRINYSHHLLNTLWDIDTPDDFLQHKVKIENLLNKKYTLE